MLVPLLGPPHVVKVYYFGGFVRRNIQQLVNDRGSVSRWAFTFTHRIVKHGNFYMIELISWSRWALDHAWMWYVACLQGKILWIPFSTSELLHPTTILHHAGLVVMCNITNKHANIPLISHLVAGGRVLLWVIIHRSFPVLDLLVAESSFFHCNDPAFWSISIY